MQIFTYKKEGFANLNIYVDRVNDQGLFFMCDFQSTSMKEWVMDGFDWELGARTFEQMEEMATKLGAELHIFENGVEVLPSEEPVEPIEVTVKPTYRESDPQSENPGDFIEGENGGTVEVVENEESENEYTITATPKTGYNKQGGWDFLGWYDEKGDLFSTDLSYTFAAEKAVTLTARFQKRWFTQTWRKNANVKSLTFEGARRVPYYTEDVNTMTLPDDTDQYAYGIDGWYVQGILISSDPEYTFTVTASIELVAKWKNTVTITPTVEPEGAGTVTPNPIESVENFPLSIKATPAEGKVFTKFVISGKESTTNPWQGWLDPGETVVAFFEDTPTT